MYKIKKTTDSKNMNEIFKNPNIVIFISNFLIITISLFLILFIFFVNIHIKINHYKNTTPSIKITISDLLKIKLEKNIEMKNNYTLRKTIYIIRKIKYLTNEYDELIKEILKEIKITKLTIITSYLNDDIEKNTYLKFNTLLIYNIINSLINKYFKNVQNDYYLILDNKEKNNINFEIEFSIRAFRIWKILIGNIKYFKRIKKEF